MINSAKVATVANELANEFSTGFYGSVIASTGDLKGITDNAIFEFNTAPLPQGPNGEIGCCTGGAGLAIPLGIDDDRKLNALRFIDFVTNHYYCLNPTASNIWSSIEVVPASIDELAEWTGATYSRPVDEVRGDVAELVAALVDEGLLVRSEADADAPAAPLPAGVIYVVPRFEKFGTLDQLMLAGE